MVFKCGHTDVIRGKYNIRDDTYENLGDLTDNHDAIQLVDFIDEVMKKF